MNKLMIKPRNIYFDSKNEMAQKFTGEKIKGKFMHIEVQVVIVVR